MFAEESGVLESSGGEPKPRLTSGTVALREFSLRVEAPYFVPDFVSNAGSEELGGVRNHGQIPSPVNEV
jgi:hypothetical protein